MCLFEKTLEMSCKGSNTSIDTVMFHVFQHGYDDTETFYFGLSNVVEWLWL